VANQIDRVFPTGICQKIWNTLRSIPIIIIVIIIIIIIIIISYYYLEVLEVLEVFLFAPFYRNDRKITVPFTFSLSSHAP